MEAKRSFFVKGFLYLVVLYTISAFFGNSNHDLIFWINIVVSLSIFAFIVGLISLLPFALCYPVFLGWIVLSILCFVVDLFCIYWFGTTLGFNLLISVFETTKDEAIGFLGTYLDQKFIIILCVFLGVSWFYFYFGMKVLKNKISSILFLCCCIFGVLSIGLISVLKTNQSFYYWSRIAYLTPLRVGESVYFVLKDGVNMQKEAKRLQAELRAQRISINKKAREIPNIVLILGESTQRGHMSLYGYGKPTTPILSKLQESGNLLVFQDVISSHASTTFSLRKVLTFKNYESQNTPWYQFQNLVSLMHQAGYQTFWLSNQEPSYHPQPYSIIGSLSDQSIFISEYKQRFDGDLLSVFDLFKTKLDRRGESSLSGGGGSFYTFHLMGTHGPYQDRYSKEFTYFKIPFNNLSLRYIARYDNAVLYNDYVVSEIFKRFSQSDSIVIYLSDHGEEVTELEEDFIGHSDDRVSRFMVEIPMMIYVSDLFKQKHPKLYKQIKHSLSRPYMSDDLIHTILDIAGIETEEFDPKRSVINDQFDATRKRIVGGKDYDTELRGQKSRY